MDPDRELSKLRKTEQRAERGSEEGEGEAEAESQVILIGWNIRSRIKESTGV